MFQLGLYYFITFSHYNSFISFTNNYSLKVVFQLLYNEFVAHIAELKILDGRIQRKVEKLESALQREARGHVEKVTDLQKSNQVAFTHFQVQFLIL